MRSVYTVFVLFFIYGCGGVKTPSGSVNTTSSPLTIALPSSSDHSSFMGFRIRGEDYYTILKGENEICIRNSLEDDWKCIELSPLDTSSSLLSYTVDESGNIYRLTSTQLAIHSWEGELVDDWMFSKADFEHSETRIIDAFYQYYPLEITANGLIYRQHRYDINFWNTDYFTIPCDVLIDFEEHHVSDFGPTFPQHQQEISYGNLYDVYHTAAENKVVYSFQTDYRLHCFDPKMGESKLVENHSKYQDGALTPFDTAFRKDMNRVYDHMKENPVYLKVLYDSYRKLFYRFYWDEVALQNAYGEFSRVFDKKLYVMVLDEQFQIINEIEINGDAGWFYSFVLEDGLYIKQFKDESDKIYFDVFKMVN